MTNTPATLAHIDPTTLVVGENVRLDTRLDKRFVASVRERGVLVPVVVYLNEAGQHVVIYGQRRTLAAVEAKCATIPAFVVAQPDDADRVVDQLAENDPREGLTTTERVAAFDQLAAFGLSGVPVVSSTESTIGCRVRGRGVGRAGVACRHLDEQC